ncbi:MAG TPA: hypothetical protein V6C63_04120, partial [Allocoleopsis sp.]
MAHSTLADLQLFLQDTLFIGHQMRNLCKIYAKNCQNSWDYPEAIALPELMEPRITPWITPRPDR